MFRGMFLLLVGIVTGVIGMLLRGSGYVVDAKLWGIIAALTGVMLVTWVSGVVLGWAAGREGEGGRQAEATASLDGTVKTLVARLNVAIARAEMLDEGLKKDGAG